MATKPKTVELLPQVRVFHLTNSDGILSELRSVYRAARRGEMPASEATKLTYILKTMAEIMTLRDMEARLDCLESGKPYRRLTDGEISDTPEAH